MTTRKLNEVRAESVAGDPLPPLAGDHLIFATNDVSATDRWQLGERKRQRHRVKRLRPKTLDGSVRGYVVTVAEEVLSREFEINPFLSGLLVGLAQRLEVTGIRHARVIGNLIHQTTADTWDYRAQIDQMPHRPARRNQRDCVAAKRVPHQQHITVAPLESAAHDIGIGFEARRPIVAGQIHGHDRVTASFKERCQQLPAPRTVPAAMDQSKRRHGVRIEAGIRSTCEKRRRVCFHRQPPAPAAARARISG